MGRGFRMKFGVWGGRCSAWWLVDSFYVVGDGSGWLERFWVLLAKIVGMLDFKVLEGGLEV